MIGALVCLYWLRALRLAREGARLFLRNLVFAVLAFIGFQFVVKGMQVPHDNAVVLAGIGAIIVFSIRSQKFRRNSLHS